MRSLQLGPLLRGLSAFLLLWGLMPAPNRASASSDVSDSALPTTPISHVVVIFDENVSFDHYFATYPRATNPKSEPAFVAAPSTPAVAGLSSQLLEANPNLANPFRLDRSQAITCDMNHGYQAEQQAADGGRMDRFVQATGGTTAGCNPKEVMGYYDGNTVTALWNYAQHYAMGDSSFGTTFGPSTLGALNLVAGQTGGVTPANVPDHIVGGTMVSDLDPTFDDCSSGTTAALTGPNVGNLLDAAGVTWGWFQGGFRPSAVVAGRASCGSQSANVAGVERQEYVAMHEPFQYYQSTANPHHLPPSSPAMIGHTDQANHQYDLTDFWTAANSGNLPAVSYLKAPAAEDGHPGYSSPLDEQTFLVETINQLEALPTWSSTAVIITYDDSDGWYDHVAGPVYSPSSDPANDFLDGAGLCGTAHTMVFPDRCGLGPRLPLLVISPWAKANYVDHQITDQSSILRFIEDNWQLGRLGRGSFDFMAGPLNGFFDFTGDGRTPALRLDPKSGEPVSGG